MTTRSFSTTCLEGKQLFTGIVKHKSKAFKDTYLWKAQIYDFDTLWEYYFPYSEEGLELATKWLMVHHYDSDSQDHNVFVSDFGKSIADKEFCRLNEIEDKTELKKSQNLRSLALRNLYLVN